MVQLREINTDKCVKSFGCLVKFIKGIEAVFFGLCLQQIKKISDKLDIGPFACCLGVEVECAELFDTKQV